MGIRRKHIFKIVKTNRHPLLLLTSYSAFFILLIYFYYQKIGAFGCFDDCFNIIGGYFLTQDKQIFSEFFYNHAPGMAYLSFLIQKLANPQDIHQLILYHRLALFSFSFLMGAVLTLRFRWPAFAFLFVFESTKFYLFGDRFLAESFIVYPLIYLLGIALSKLNKLKVTNFDYVLTGFFVWLVIIFREPFAPLTLFLYIIILWNKENIKFKAISLTFFGILSGLTLINISIGEAYFNVFSLNKERSASEIAGRGSLINNLFTIFMYPLYALFNGEKTMLRLLQIVISLVFLDVIFNLFKNKEFKQIILIIFILGLANIRYISPGLMYFEAFHMLIWYALIIFITFFLIGLWIKKENKFWIVLMPIIIVTVFSLLSKDSFIRKTDNAKEFNTSYANDYTYGTGIKILSKYGDHIFLEEKDDLIYWVSGLDTSYKYSWYTSLMPLISKYNNERKKMFSENPPDFYYDACFLLNSKKHRSYLPIFDKQYKRIDLNGKPSCLLIKKTKLEEINESAWEKASALGFSAPKISN